MFCEMAAAGITAAALSAIGRSTTSVALAPSGSGLGVAGLSRARKVRVVEAACGDNSRNTTSKDWSGALVSVVALLIALLLYRLGA